MCAMSKAPLLSVRRRRSSRLSHTMWPSWYLVAGLSSVRRVAGLATTGVRSSRAEVDRLVEEAFYRLPTATHSESKLF